MNDEIEVLAGRVMVHSHLDAPCTRCKSMDLHTVEDCAVATRARYLPMTRCDDGE